MFARQLWKTHFFASQLFACLYQFDVEYSFFACKPMCRSHILQNTRYISTCSHRASFNNSCRRCSGERPSFPLAIPEAVEGPAVELTLPQSRFLAGAEIDAGGSGAGMIVGRVVGGSAVAATGADDVSAAAGTGNLPLPWNFFALVRIGQHQLNIRNSVAYVQLRLVAEYFVSQT